jgi:fluoride exporter
VAFGGTVGAVARWAVIAATGDWTFPWPTLVVNVVGCFVVGVLTRSPRSTAVLAGVGFAGGLTTFSTFSLEVADLLEGSQAGIAVTYVAASLGGGLAAVVAGRDLVRRW